MNMYVIWIIPNNITIVAVMLVCIENYYVNVQNE